MEETKFLELSLLASSGRQLKSMATDGISVAAKAAVYPSIAAAGRIRLIQHRPAWRLHALLRFTNTPYDCENCELPYAMGQQLPLLIDGSFVFTERLAMEHIARGRIPQKFSLTLLDSTSIIVNDEHAIIDIHERTSLVNELNVISMSSFIDNNLAEVTYKLKCNLDSSGRGDVKGLQGLTRHIYDFSNGSSSQGIFSMIFTKSSFFRSQQDRFRQGSYSYYSNDKLLLEKTMQEIYKMLSARLILNGGETLSGSKHFGVAEAALFAHLAEVLSHPQLNQQAMNQTVLMEFFRGICNNFFLQPKLTIISWACVVNEIARNNYLKDSTSQTFLKEYIINAGEQICPCYDQNISDRTRLTKFNLLHRTNDDGFSSVVISYSGCIYLSAIFASFGLYLLRK